MRGFRTEADGLPEAPQHDFREAGRAAHRPVRDGRRGRDPHRADHDQAEDVRPGVERVLRAHRRGRQDADADGLPRRRDPAGRLRRQLQHPLRGPAGQGERGVRLLGRCLCYFSASIASATPLPLADVAAVCPLLFRPAVIAELHVLHWGPAGRGFTIWQGNMGLTKNAHICAPSVLFLSRRREKRVMWQADGGLGGLLTFSN